MGDFPRLAGTNLVCFQGNDGDAFSVEGRELYFITFTLFMYQHDGTDIASRQTVLRSVTGQNYIFEFFNH
jgi:hypothetical protein